MRELNHKARYWDVQVDPARKIRIGNKLTFDDDPSIVAEVIDNTTSRGRTFRFLTDYNNEEFVPRLYALSLPSYDAAPTCASHRDKPKEIEQSVLQAV